MTGEGVRVGGRLVEGAVTDAETRCAHYGGPDDVLAILFSCCLRWFPCHACHDEAAGHPIVPWPAGDRGRPALLCGRCGGVSTIAEYVAASACARCGGGFNPGCALHRPIYFG